MVRLFFKTNAFLALVGILYPVQQGFTQSEFLSPPIGSLVVTEGVFYNDDGLPHRGIDYRAPAGNFTVIRAAADGYGITSYNPERYGLGQFVLIRHDNGYSTLYAHLSRLNVFKSFPYSDRHFPSTSSYEWQRVFKGQIIGYAGSTGTDVTHLHFEVARNPAGTWSGHYDGKLDPYDIGSKSPYYPPVGSRFAGCGADQLWIPSDQTCLTGGGTDVFAPPWDSGRVDGPPLSVFDPCDASTFVATNNIQTGETAISLNVDFRDHCDGAPFISFARAFYQKTTSVLTTSGTSVVVRLKYFVSASGGISNLGTTDHDFRVSFDLTDQASGSLPHVGFPSSQAFIEDSCTSSVGQPCQPTGNFAPGLHEVTFSGVSQCNGLPEPCSLPDVRTFVQLFSTSLQQSTVGTQSLQLRIDELAIVFDQ